MYNFFNESRPNFEILPVSKYVYVHLACVISRSSNDRLRSKEDLICVADLKWDEKNNIDSWSADPKTDQQAQKLWSRLVRLMQCTWW